MVMRKGKQTLTKSKPAQDLAGWTRQADKGQTVNVRAIAATGAKVSDRSKRARARVGWEQPSKKGGW